MVASISRYRLHIFTVYIHPNSNIEESIFIMASLYTYVIIVGDFNINNVTKRRQLNNFLQSTDFTRAYTPPTFLMPNNHDSTPDILLFTNNLKHNLQNINVNPDLGSDHLSITFDLVTNIPIMDEPFSQINLKSCNFEKVNDIMLQFIHNENTINENLVETFNSSLHNAIKNSCKSINKKHYTHELPPFIIKLIKHKRKKLREYFKKIYNYLSMNTNGRKSAKTLTTNMEKVFGRILENSLSIKLLIITFLPIHLYRAIFTLKLHKKK